MAIPLPALPRRTRLSPKVVRYGGPLTPTLGGPSINIARLGSRYQIGVELPTMDTDCAARWIAAREQAVAEGDKLRLTLPQLVAAAGVTGRTATSGAGAGLVINNAAGVAVGMWFSFVAGGHAYLHLVTALAGTALSVAPLLRADPAGLALEFVAPQVDGDADETAWTMESLRFVGQSFTLTEDR